MKANTTLKGLNVVFDGRYGNLYPQVIHTQSGLPILNLSNHPINCGKTEFCLKVDEALRSFDWERDEKTIGNDMECYKAVQELRYETTRNDI